MFAYVENGVVQEVASELPRSFKNVSGFDLLSEAEQMEHGWYPVNGTPSAHDLAYQNVSAPTFTFDVDHVVASYDITDRPVEDVRSEVISAITQLRETHIQSGVVWNNNTFDTDVASQGRITAIVTSVAAGLTLPDNFTWRTADNTDVPMTAQDLKDLAQAVLDHVDACFKTSWTHKDAVRALNTAAEIAAYDYTTGWPQ